MTTPNPSKLTRLQYSALKIYRRYETEDFTVSQMPDRPVEDGS